MATAVVAFSQLANELEEQGLTPVNGERIAAELAKAFSVQGDEVAVLKLEKTNLVFVYPAKLKDVGSIPLNQSSSVAARTAVTKRAEVINNFSQTKHASVFESVPLSAKKSNPEMKSAGGPKVHSIQKLMTVPVVSAAGVQGVIQISRKGENAPAAGADFTPADLQKLVAIATSLAKCFK
jgi:transcriptional regulator with GAF, ATPase, and Fis domain